MKKKIEQIGLVAVVLLIITAFLVIGFQRTMSVNESHQEFSRLITKELGVMTPAMIKEGNLLLGKAAAEFPNPDYKPRLYEKQPSRIFSTWYLVSTFESKGQAEKVKDLRRDLNEFIEKN